MRVAIGIGTFTDDWETTATWVAEAERVGADDVWAGENWGHDIATRLAFLAARTTKMRLGAGIFQVDARTPAMTAMTAMSLQAMSNGRFMCGLGASGPQVMEGWHGVHFDRPVTRVRECLEIVRMLSRGERVLYDGRVHQLPLPGGEGKALKTSAEPREFPIYVAALSQVSLEMTGELADGWTGAAYIPEAADNFFGHIETGAKRAGRSLKDIDLVVPGNRLDITDDVERAVNATRRPLSFSVGGMGSRQHNFYKDSYARAGYSEIVDEIQKVWLGGDRKTAEALVPMDMALKANLIGTEAMVRERIRAHAKAGATCIRVDVSGRSMEDRINQLGRFVELVKQETAATAG
jgi:F420-dependent oxidoreductase-like protein